MCRVTITASRPGASPWILPPARLSLLCCCFGTAARAVHRYQLSNCLHCQPHRTVLATNLLWLQQVSARLPGVACHESLCVTSRFSVCWDTLMFDHDVGGYSDMVISFAIIPQTLILFLLIRSILFILEIHVALVWRLMWPVLWTYIESVLVHCE